MEACNDYHPSEIQLGPADDYVEIPLSEPLQQQQQQPQTQPEYYPYNGMHVPPPQHIAVNEYEQQRFRQFNTQTPGIPPLVPVFHNDSERFIAYNTGYNAGYVRGYYVAVNNMNNREGQRLHQRYANRGGGGVSGSYRGGGSDGFVPRGRGGFEGSTPRGRGRGGRGRGGGGVPNNHDTFVSVSGQQVQILRNVGQTGLSNVHFPPLQSTKQTTTIGDENV